MSTAYRTVFCVQGSGEFPFDMLRYDCCFPYTGNDVASMVDSEMKLEDGRLKLRTVKLCKYHGGKDVNLTPERWKSFTWRLDADSVATEKMP